MEYMSRRGCHEGKQGRTTVILARTLRRLCLREKTYIFGAQIIFSKTVLREAFRVTLAVTKVDSLLRATSLKISSFEVKNFSKIRMALLAKLVLVYVLEKYCCKREKAYLRLY